MNFSDLTTLKIGGPVKKVIVVKTTDDLIKNLTASPLPLHPYLIIGSGSNLLVSDQGFNGVILKNEILGIEKNGNNLIVKSGTVLQDLVDFANENGLAGLETLAGIPGTVGGAIFGNAGAYGQTIVDCLESVRAIDPITYHLSRITKKECQFEYRDSIFKRNDFIITEAVFSLTSSEPANLKQASLATIKKREVKYPPGIKCPGSFFKNIPQDMILPEILDKLPKKFVLFGKVSAGALLESVGAKGAKLGDIKIAPYHANLFINEGNGSAADFYHLAKTYSQKVFDRHRIRLEPEVQLINLPKFN